MAGHQGRPVRAASSLLKDIIIELNAQMKEGTPILCCSMGMLQQWDEAVGCRSMGIRIIVPHLKDSREGIHGRIPEYLEEITCFRCPVQ